MMIALIGAPGTSGLPTPPAQATPRLPTFAKLPLERMTYSGALPTAPGGLGLDMVNQYLIYADSVNAVYGSTLGQIDSVMKATADSVMHEGPSAPSGR